MYQFGWLLVGKSSKSCSHLMHPACAGRHRDSRYTRFMRWSRVQQWARECLWVSDYIVLLEAYAYTITSTAQK